MPPRCKLCDYGMPWARTPCDGCPDPEAWNGKRLEAGYRVVPTPIPPQGSAAPGCPDCKHPWEKHTEPEPNDDGPGGCTFIPSGRIDGPYCPCKREKCTACDHEVHNGGCATCPCCVLPPVGSYAANQARASQPPEPPETPPVPARAPAISKMETTGPRHSTNAEGDCPSWCKACATERAERANHRCASPCDVCGWVCSFPVFHEARDHRCDKHCGIAKATPAATPPKTAAVTAPGERGEARERERRHLVAAMVPKLVSFFNVDVSGADADALVEELERDATACAEAMVPAIEAYFGVTDADDPDDNTSLRVMRADTEVENARLEDALDKEKAGHAVTARTLVEVTAEAFESNKALADMTMKWERACAASAENNSAYRGAAEDRDKAEDERDAAIAERDRLLSESQQWRGEREGLVRERDEAKAEADRLHAALMEANRACEKWMKRVHEMEDRE